MWIQLNCRSALTAFSGLVRVFGTATHKEIPMAPYWKVWQLSTVIALCLAATPAVAGPFDAVFAGKGSRTVLGTAEQTQFSFAKDGATLGPFPDSDWPAFF